MLKRNPKGQRRGGNGDSCDLTQYGCSSHFHARCFTSTSIMVIVVMYLSCVFFGPVESIRINQQHHHDQRGSEGSKI